MARNTSTGLKMLSDLLARRMQLYTKLLSHACLNSFILSEWKRKRHDMTPVSKSLASSSLIKNMETNKGTFATV